MLLEFPGDIDLMENMVGLCLDLWKKPDIAKRWLIELTKIRSAWLDYAFLSRVEASLGSITLAKEYLKKAKDLHNRRLSGIPKK